MQLQNLLACSSAPSMNGIDVLPSFLSRNSPKTGLDKCQRLDWIQFDGFETISQK
jgi:hypothetical protein